MALSSAQPNLALDAPRLSARFWTVVALTGVGAGLAGALLMRLLYAIEKFAWSYGSEEGDYIDAVNHTSTPHRLVVLGVAGLVAVAGSWLLRRRRRNKGHAGDLAQAIWLGTGRLPFFRTVGNALLSIVVVGLGASLGREGAIKQTGAAFASQLGEWLRLSAPQRVWSWPAGRAPASQRPTTCLSAGRSSRWRSSSAPSLGHRWCRRWWPRCWARRPPGSCCQISRCIRLTSQPPPSPRSSGREWRAR